MSNILALPDIHAPFTKRGFISWCKDIYEQYNCKRTVVLGDIVDGHTLGRWPKHPEAMNIEYEVSLAKDVLAELYSAFPGKVELVLGNHDDRLKKRMYEIGIPDQFIPDIREIYDIPKKWHIHPDGTEIDGVYYYHGHKKGGQMPALAMAQVMGQPVVCGHHHGIAGVNKRRPNGKLLWGMDLGCGVDISSYGMYYAKETLMQPVLGCGVVTDGVPHHFLMGE